MCSMISLVSVLVVLAVSTSTSGGGVCITKIKDGKFVSEGDCENSKGRSVIMDLERKLKARESTETSESQSVTTTSNHPVNQDTTLPDATTATAQESSETSESQSVTTTSTHPVNQDTTLPDATTARAQGQCEFNASGICYWSYLNYNYTHFINFTEAQQICADKGSVPAYFPSELAYNKTVESVRAKIRNWAFVYTGVMIDYQTFKVTYPDTAVYMKWYPGHPRSRNDATNVFLVIRSSDDDIYQGMYNYYPRYRLHGVVCQNNLN